MWFVFSTALVVTLLGACLAPLNLAYQHLAGGRGFNLTPRFGVWGVAILALLIADLLAWYSHWLHHHVPSLWYFHAVHHSQTNLNVLSDNRTHFVETFVSAVVAYVPARILGLSAPDAVKLTSLTIFVSAVIHTNVRTNLGPLRNVFVSPQAHRVHHSISVEHFNTNYGTVFMFWDLLFRTRSRMSTCIRPRASRMSPSRTVSAPIRSRWSRRGRSSSRTRSGSCSNETPDTPAISDNRIPLRPRPACPPP